jgi:hypothetical protein
MIDMIPIREARMPARKPPRAVARMAVANNMVRPWEDNVGWINKIKPIR